MKYRWKTKPYKHQVKAVKKLLSTSFGGALLMEPRTGKTKAIIDYASILHKGDKVDKVLVACPLSVMGVWEDEINAHCPFDSEVVLWDRDERTEFDPTEWETPRLKWLIINIDAFSTPDSRTIQGKTHKMAMGKKKLRKILRAWAPDLMVIDESHRIGNPSAKRTYYLQSVAWEFGRGKKQKTEKPLVPYRVIATGTPVTKKKKVFTVYSQWKFLNPHRFAELSTADLFKEHFGVWTDRNGYPQWLRNKNISELRERMGEDSFMVKRDECFDLPPRSDQVIPVTLDSDTYKVYRDMEQEMLAKLKNGEITTAQIRLVQSMRLAQITSGLAKTDSGKLYGIGREKLEITQDILRDLWEADERVVVAARFVADIQRLGSLSSRKQVPTYQVRGKQTRRERDQNIRGFREGEGAALMLVQPQAASLGIDLSNASVMIWYSLTSSFVDWSQTCDRIALSRQSTSYLYLLAEGPDKEQTVDHDIYHSLLEDKDLSDLMLARLEES